MINVGEPGAAETVRVLLPGPCGNPLRRPLTRHPLNSLPTVPSASSRDGNAPSETAELSFEDQAALARAMLTLGAGRDFGVC